MIYDSAYKIAWPPPFPTLWGLGVVVSIIIPIGMIKGEALNSIKSLKQTGRANATVERFYFADLFRGSIVF